MALNGQQVDAVDPLIGQYAQRLQVFDRNRYPHVRFFSGRLEDYQSEAAYAHVFCLNAINHVRDMERCMDVLAAVLAPGGCLVMSVDAHRSRLLKYLFRVLPGDILHPHQYDDAGYTAMIECCGLVLLRKEILKEEAVFRHYLYVAQKPL